MNEWNHPAAAGGLGLAATFFFAGAAGVAPVPFMAAAPLSLLALSAFAAAARFLAISFAACRHRRGRGIRQPASGSFPRGLGIVLVLVSFHAKQT